MKYVCELLFLKSDEKVKIFEHEERTATAREDAIREAKKIRESFTEDFCRRTMMQVYETDGIFGLHLNVYQVHTEKEEANIAQLREGYSNAYHADNESDLRL